MAAEDRLLSKGQITGIRKVPIGDSRLAEVMEEPAAASEDADEELHRR